MSSLAGQGDTRPGHGGAGPFTTASRVRSLGDGTFAANEKHRYQFAATFDSSAGNVYQGANSQATFTWNAVQ